MGWSQDTDATERTANSRCAVVATRAAAQAEDSAAGGGLAGLGDLAGLQAGGAHVDALGRPVDQGADALDVGVPAPAGAAVGVADVGTERGVLAAHLTHRGHGWWSLSKLGNEPRTLG